MFFKRISAPVFLAVFAFVLISQTTSAQTDRAAIEGTVTDASGGAVSGAKIDITAVATGLTDEKMTNQYGQYRFPGIAIGIYKVVVESSGFATKEIDAVEVRVGETRTLDIRLEVGKREEKIVVQAESEPYERSTAESAIVIGTDQIENLPTNGRNWSTLTILAPWAQDDGGGDQRTIRFAGRARDDNNFTFDGVDATGIQEQAQKSTTRLQISEDAISEYRVDSALYDAQYGSQSGGQVDVVTKSGTNDFHGTVFGYLRNNVFDAREFNDPPQIPPFRLGQFGGTFGGPIKKDKAFFFVNYEGLRQLQALTYTAAVPDPGLQQQILTTSPVMCPILQAWPWQQSAVAQNTALGCSPKHVFSDSLFVDQGILNPSDPNFSPGTSLFTHESTTTIHEDTWLARFDYTFSPNTSLYARAQRDIASTVAPLGNALDQQGVFNHPANYIVALVHSFSPNLLNVAKFGINRSPFHNPQICNFPLAVSTQLFEPLNDCNTDNEVGTTFSGIDDVTITRGKHTFKTGIEIRRVRLNQGITADNNIAYQDLPGDVPNQSLIDNNIDNLFYRSTWALHYLRHTFVLPYFQDEWKVTPTLTINAGIRWEYYSPVTEAHNATTVFDLTAFQGICIGSGSSNTLRPFEPASCPKNPALEFPNYRNWDPRIGLAWAPSMFHGKTVIRSGFGIYSGSAQNDDRNAGLESDTVRQGLQQGVDVPDRTLHYGPGYLANPPDFGVPATPALQPRALFRNHRDLYVEQWGLTIEHELPANFLFTTSYLGTHGVRLFARNYTNLCDQTIYQDDATGNQCVRPLDGNPIMIPQPSGPPLEVPYGLVDIKNDIGGSSYNGLLLSVQRRITNGWSFQANYVWSHSINDGSVGGGEANAPQNALCFPCERGPSIYDIRHNVVVNTVYLLPFGPNQRFLSSGGFLGKVIGGWQLSSIGTWHTGHPLTVYMNIPGSQVPDGNDQSSQRPDIVPGVPLTVTPTAANGYQLINAAAFAAPPVDPNTGIETRYGNESNGLIRSPHVWQIDLQLSKETKLTERFSLEFGVQAFNIFNHTQFADPNNVTLDYNCTGAPPITCATSGSGTFGQITSVNGYNINNDNFFSDNVGTGFARQLQFMLRLKF
jgi:Carboxypeptidase regulatory-like domain